MSNVQAGEGWRLLEIGEIKQQGDEYWQEWNQYWHPCESFLPVGNLTPPTRRRIGPSLTLDSDGWQAWGGSDGSGDPPSWMHSRSVDLIFRNGEVCMDCDPWDMSWRHDVGRPGLEHSAKWDIVKWREGRRFTADGKKEEGAASVDQVKSPESDAAPARPSMEDRVGLEAIEAAAKQMFRDAYRRAGGSDAAIMGVPLNELSPDEAIGALLLVLGK